MINHRLSIRYLLGATLVAVLACTACIVAYNIIYIPRGFHVIEQVLKHRQNPKSDSIWIKYVTHPALSKWIFRYIGNYCDAPADYEGESFFGKDWTIPLMLQALTEPHARRDEAWSNLERAVSLCNVNATAEGDVMPHLFTAIFYGQPDAVQLLLKAGAKPDMQLSVPGKPVDGLNALQYAKRRLEKPENQANQQAYTEVVEMLQTHAAEPRAPKGTVP